MSVDPFRLTVNVTHADGSTTRWAYDEPDPDNKPQNLTFGTVKPGGFGDFSFTLPRGLIAGDDENLLDSVSITGPGGQVAYEGRVHRLPRQQGDGRTLTVQGLGWASNLSDNRAYSQLFIDRQLSNWVPPSASRIAVASAYDLTNPFGAVFDPTYGPSLVANSPGKITNVVSEAWYDAGPSARVKRFIANSSGLVQLVPSDAYLSVKVSNSQDDVYHLAYEFSSELKGGSSVDYTFANGYRYGSMQWSYSTGPAGGDGVTYGVRFSGVSVHGDHGLALTADGSGYLASDIIKSAISSAAPLLTYDSTSVPDTSFGVPQAVYASTTPADVILDVNKYELRSYYVWENRKFWYVDDSTTGTVWQARLSDGAKVSQDGDDVVQLASSVYVQFPDEYGIQRVYAPTGGVGDYTSSLLLGDGTDPYTTHGINAPMTLTLSSNTTAAGALQIGQAWLAENNAPKRSGQFQIQGLTRHPTEGLVPSWRIRAGDYIQLTDLPDSPPYPIVSTAYDHNTRTNTVTLQANPLFRLDSLVQRLAVSVGVINQ